MSPPTKTWKAFERYVASRLGGQRIPASGNGGIKGDVRHDTLLLECKHGKQVPGTLYKWYAEAVRDAITESRNRGVPVDALAPVLVVRRPRETPLVVISLDDFAKLHRELAAFRQGNRVNGSSVDGVNV